MSLELQLKRSYYFAEAMAFYEAYYNPVREHITDAAPQKLVDSLKLPGREQDRPLTWVPLVFHCTTPEAFEQIVATNFINPPVSFSELPIGELDRMRIRTQAPKQIAIGFPRRCIQAFGATPVLYTKHNLQLQAVLRAKPELLSELSPFVDMDGDVGALQELRVPNKLPISEAVWILTTERDADKKPLLEHRERYEEQLGKIPVSLWHRTHQMGILGEWQYLRIVRSPSGALRDLSFMGEHYWRRECFTYKTCTFRMPAGRDFELQFLRRTERADQFEGPLTFLDAAFRIRSLLNELTGGKVDLPHALVQEK